MSELKTFTEHRYNSTPSAGDLLIAEMEAVEAPKVEKPKGQMGRSEGYKAVGDALKAEESGIIDKAGAVVGDVIKGVTTEGVSQVAGGVADAFNELMQFTDEVGEGIESALGIDIPVLQVYNDKGEFDLDLIKRTDEFKTLELPTTDTADTVTGNLIRGVSQFLAPFSALNKTMKVAQTANKIVKGGKIVASGAIVDSAFFEPMEQNLSNLIQEFPVLQNPVTDYLEADEGDSKAQRRFENAVEGLALGAVGDTFIKSIKGYRNIANARRKKLELEKDTQMAKDIADTGKLITEQKTVDIESKLGEEGAPDFEIIEGEMPAEIKVDESGNITEKAPAKNALNINMRNIETTDDVKRLINGVAEANASKINEARREVITLEETEKLADDLGMTVETLLNRNKGEAYNAEQLLASRQILVASGEKVFKLAEEARNGDQEALIALKRAMDVHSAIQEQVSGAIAESGRALGAMRVAAKAKTEADLLSVLDDLGGEGNLRRVANILSQAQSPRELNAMIKDLAKPGGMDMIMESRYGSMLSGPITHSKNIISNALMMMFGATERKAGQIIGVIRQDESIYKGEASAHLYGAMNSISDAFVMAYKVFKQEEGLPTKIEIERRPAITAENVKELPMVQKAGSALKKVTPERLQENGIIGRVGDFIGASIDAGGEIIRVPTRMLEAGDAFFNILNYRAEIQARAFNQATGEGLQGDALALRIAELVENPPVNMKDVAEQKAREFTLTDDAGEITKSLQGAMSSIDNALKFPATRLIVPFIKTPVNALRFTFQRTPLAMISKRYKEAIAKGGADADIARGQVAMGSAIMLTGTNLAASGHITGGGPSNPDERRVWALNNQPYSIKVGDEWISYGGIEPLATFLGFAADFTDIVGQMDDLSADELFLAGAFAVSENFTNKTFMSGLGDFINAMRNSTMANDTEALQKWLARMNVATVMPLSSLSFTMAKTNDPVMRSANGLLDEVKRRIPGYTDDLPPRRNVFGDVITYGGAWGPDTISPFYKNDADSDDVGGLLWDNNIKMTMPRKTIQGVELTPKQYDDFLKFSAGVDESTTLRDVLGQIAKDKSWQGLPVEQKQIIVDKVVTGFRKKAQGQMLEKYEDLRNKTIQVKKERKGIQ